MKINMLNGLTDRKGGNVSINVNDIAFIREIKIQLNTYSEEYVDIHFLFGGMVSVVDKYEKIVEALERFE